MTTIELVTMDFIEQITYRQAKVQVAIGIAPEESELVYELMMHRDFQLGSRMISRLRAMHEAESLVQLIKENHARVKILADMAKEDRPDKDVIAALIQELYDEAEDALAIIEEVSRAR